MDSVSDYANTPLSLCRGDQGTNRKLSGFTSTDVSSTDVPLDLVQLPIRSDNRALIVYQIHHLFPQRLVSAMPIVSHALHFVLLLGRTRKIQVDIIVSCKGANL